MRVIVADDEPDTRALCARALVQECPEIDVVEVGGPADLDEALKLAPHLLITDYDLHWIDGFVIFERVKAEHPACHAIMFTGTGNEELAVRAMKAGFDDYLVKSNSQLRRLATTARIVIERGRERRVLAQNRDLVLAELYHRLHNNLQIVISLIRETEKRLQSAADRRLLSDLRGRIQALSQLQEQFYRSPDYSRVAFGGFLSDLAVALVGLASPRVSLVEEISPVELPVDVAVPLGLLANELLSNAIQHAFSDQQGQLSVGLRREQDHVLLTVADDGIGLFEERTGDGRGWGLHLVERLAQQIDGRVVREAREPGTAFMIRVPV